MRRPVSRVLSRVTIYLGRRLPDVSSDLPKEDAGRIIFLLLGLAPGGVYLAGQSPNRWWALTPPLHPCHFMAVFISVALSLGLPPLAVSQHLALRSPDFPRTRPCGTVLAVTQPAHILNCSSVPDINTTMPTRLCQETEPAEFQRAARSKCSLSQALGIRSFRRRSSMVSLFTTVYASPLLTKTTAGRQKRL